MKYIIKPKNIITAIVIITVLFFIACNKVQDHDKSPESSLSNASSSPNASTSPSGGAASVPDTSTSSSPATKPSTAASTSTNPSSVEQPVAEQKSTDKASSPARKIGEIIFTDGTVTINRAGKKNENADIGSIVEAYDVIITGPKSRAEIDIGSGKAGGATIKLAENTAFYFDTKELDEARKTSIQLLSGAIAVKVDKLANGSFNVATDQSVLGVRGTVFIVDTVPDGAMLVTCDTGSVSVKSSGQVLAVEPGVVVEQPSNAEVKTVSMDKATVAGYRSSWKKNAYDEFATKALLYISKYTKVLDEGQSKLEVSTAKLKTYTATLDAWRVAKSQNKVPSFTAYTAEKKAVASALFACLKDMFLVERAYYRLLELRNLNKAGIGNGTLYNGIAASDYFANFDVSNKNIIQNINLIHEALLLFSWVADGSPLGQFFIGKLGDLGTSSIFFDD